MIKSNETKPKRIVTKIGDVFCVEFSNNTKGYFQFIAIDKEQLGSSVIRAFKTHYPIYPDIMIEDIVKDEVDFYAHTILRAGIEYDTWYKVGKSADIGLEELKNVIFGHTSQFDRFANEIKKVNPLTNWILWHVNEPSVYAGVLPLHLYNIVEDGAVMPHHLIKARMESGYYPEYTELYDLSKRHPRSEYRSYVTFTKNNEVFYMCFQGDCFDKAVILTDCKKTKITKDDAFLNNIEIAKKKFSDTCWRKKNFITEEEFNKVWDSID